MDGIMNQSTSSLSSSVSSGMESTILEKEESNIQVVCRIRPLSEFEIKSGFKFVTKFPSESEDAICIGGKVYVFDKVFKPSSSQVKVYEETAKPIVKDVLCGYNGTIFAYGQTSSGKTYTMEGDPEAAEDPEMVGIVPRIIDDIFNFIYSMNNGNIEFHIKVSYFEIYLDKIRDLLDVSKTNLFVHEDKNRSTYVKGITERFVTSPEQMMAVVEEGKLNRHISVTNMNEHSSRSHSVFLINVKQEFRENGKCLIGKLYLVDLAGSEKVSKSGAEGQVLDEAKNINKSLSALGNVISSLADGNKSHIPYRDSKLTRILQESLGGNSRTTIIICCSPASFNELETKSTLEFGKRAKTIKNVVVVNEELTADEWKRRFEREREKLIKFKMLNEKDRQEERSKLFARLDEKDDLLDQQTILIDELKEQLVSHKTLITGCKKENVLLKEEITRLEGENEAGKEEIKDVLQALEELAMDYDDKCKEVEVSNRKLLSLQKEFEEKLSTLTCIQNELDSAKETGSSQRKKVNEMLTNLLKDLSDIGGSLSHDGTSCNNTTTCQPMSPIILSSPIQTSNGGSRDENSQINNELTVARLYISKMKNLAFKCKKRIESNEKELSESRLQIQEMESKMKMMTQLISKLENEKSILQTNLDSLKNEFTSLSTSKNEVKEELLQEKEKLSSTFNGKMSKIRDGYEKQLNSLRSELSNKQQLIDTIKDNNQRLKDDLNQLKNEHERCSMVEEEKEVKVKTLMAINEQQSMERQQLDESIARELQTLQILRKMFLHMTSNDQCTKVKRSGSACSNISDDLPDLTDEQKSNMHFVDLDLLTRVHQQLSRASMNNKGNKKQSSSKLEKRLREMTDRVSELELSLRDSEDAAIKYQQQIDRLVMSLNADNVDFKDSKRDSAIDSIYKSSPSPTIESNSLLSSPSPTSSPGKWSSRKKLSTLNLKHNKQKIFSPTIAFYLLTRFLD